MRPTRHLVASGLALCLCLSASAADAQPRAGGPKPAANDAAVPAELSFTTHLDRSAVWLGDQFHYQIFVEHSPKVQFILENLNGETINLDPLRVVNVTSSTSQLKNGNERLVVDLTLSAFTTGVPELAIPQLTLFYFRRDAATMPAAGEGAAAESLTIPGPTIGIRSTLVARSSALRDAVTVTSWPRSRWIAAGIGWSALVLLIGGLTWQGALLVHRRRRKSGPDPRKAMAAIRQRWSRGAPKSFGSPEVVKEFYGRSYHDLKEYLGQLLETPTEGLTAAEMRAEMTRLSAKPELIDWAGTVFDTCENALYARNPAELNGEAAKGVASRMEQIFEAGSRR